MRLDLLKGRGERVQSTPQLVEFPSLRPARKLLADVVGINVTRQEKGGFKRRLIAYDFDQSRKFHAVILPLMVYYRNESSGLLPIRLDFAVVRDTWKTDRFVVT